MRACTREGEKGEGLAKINLKRRNLAHENPEHCWFMLGENLCENIPFSLMS